MDFLLDGFRLPAAGAELGQGLGADRRGKGHRCACQGEADLVNDGGPKIIARWRRAGQGSPERTVASVAIPPAK